MRSGLFFEMDASSRLDKGLVIFRYKRVFQQDVDRYLPVFLVLEKGKLSCFYTNQMSEEGNTLFTLPYSDYQNPSGKLSRELEKLYNSEKKLDQERPSCNSLPVYWQGGFEHGGYGAFETAPPTCFEKPDKKECSNKNIVIHRLKSISLRTIFLDFLYDLKYTRIFQQSPYFEELKKVSRENLLLKAIIAKLDFHERKKQHHSSSKGNSLTASLLSDARTAWVKALMEESMAEFIGKKTWFEGNLEVQAKGTLDKTLLEPEELLAQRLVQNDSEGAPKDLPTWEAEIIEKLSDWYLRRYNLKRAFLLLTSYHAAHIYILLMPILFVSSYLFVKAYLPQDWCTWDLIELMSPLGAFGSILLLLYIIAVSTTSRHKVIFTSAVHFLSPRLNILLLITWLTYTKLTTLFELPGEQVALYYLMACILVPLYLFKEVKAEAPDLSGSSTLLRIFGIMFLAMGLSFVLGVIVVDIALSSLLTDPGTSVKYQHKISHLGNLNFSWEIMWKNTPFVFFTAVFLNSLFKGKRFTGF